MSFIRNKDYTKADANYFSGHSNTNLHISQDKYAYAISGERKLKSEKKTQIIGNNKNG